MKIPFKALETAEFSIAHPKRELALQEKKKIDAKHIFEGVVAVFLLRFVAF
jgi:hypothetical protein